MGTSVTELESSSARRPFSPAVTVDALRHSDSTHVVSRKFETVLTLLEFAVDFCSVFAGIVVAYRCGTLLVPSAIIVNVADLFTASLCVSTLFALMLDRAGAYRRGNGLLRVKETERVLRVSAEVFLLLLVICYFGQSRFPIVQFVIAAAIVPAALIAEKQLVYVIVRSLHAKGFGVSKVAIYGAGYTGRRVFSALVRSPKLGLDPIFLVDDNRSITGERVFELAYRRERSVPVVSGPITKDFLLKHGISNVVIAIPSLARERFVEVLNATAHAGASLTFVPNHYVPFDCFIEHADIDGLLLASLSKASQRLTYTVAKRIADLLLGTVMSVLVVPVCVVIAAIVKIDSPGPVLFKQRRVGVSGEVFEMYKFRTMYTEAPQYSYSPVASEDPRITRVGRFLRRTSLDEIPQLINVFRGDMSLVGPRPEMPFIVDTYMPRHRQRLQVKPGITGLWQISADRELLIHENIEYDLYYIRNRNFFMDIAILLHTLLFFMRGI